MLSPACVMVIKSQWWRVPCFRRVSGMVGVRGKALFLCASCIKLKNKMEKTSKYLAKAPGDLRKSRVGKVLALQIWGPQFNPQNSHIKKARHGGTLIISPLGSTDQRVPGVPGPATLTTLVSSRASRGPVSKLNIGAEQMTQWTNTCDVQACVPAFESPASMWKARRGHACPWLQSWKVVLGREDQWGLMAASLDLGSVRDPVSRE